MKYLTPPQLADKFQISPATVYSKIHSGEWECTKLGSRIYRFSEAQVSAIEAGTNTPQRKTNKTRLRAALKSIA
ncbi:hypothetical protein BLJ79_21420 [Arthrobacter sp. UCD-GKA]|uniref:helix-turn-helix domain-containing protein n=1 Tax=Arthrobacter sp. UCD-GKA TaxID=1913576 RepID=UPI0008DD0EA0|nr:helix-turn-helix domain-containing protein [Arthrobacter sp. UCD-GKA]OIH81923.1 hypothetical protein BLJ79_21420 [Arthrobacter sp. UCD-GKA]